MAHINIGLLAATASRCASSKEILQGTVLQASSGEACNSACSLSNRCTVNSSALLATEAQRFTRNTNAHCFHIVFLHTLQCSLVSATSHAVHCNVHHYHIQPKFKARQRNSLPPMKISALRNLGPASEQDLNAAGIHTAKQLKEVGAEAAFIKILAHRRELGQSTQSCTAVYLYALYGAIHDLDWRDIPEQKKAEFKQLAAEIRQSGSKP